MITVVSTDVFGSCSEIDCKILALQMWKETENMEMNGHEYFTLISKRQKFCCDQMYHDTSFRLLTHASLHIIQGVD